MLVEHDEMTMLLDAAKAFGAELYLYEGGGAYKVTIGMQGEYWVASYVFMSDTREVIAVDRTTRLGCQISDALKRADV